jgi:cytochrome c556
MRKEIVIRAVAAVLCAGFMGSASAQAKPDQMVKQRQAAMVLQLKYFGPIAAMAQGKAPYNADIVARNAAYLEVVTRLAWDDFDPSTANEKTRALPEIYKQGDKFKAEYERLQAEVGKLAVAARARDEAGVKAAFGGVGKVCGSCHDTFRAK